MKKTLLALAILGSFAGSASAQTSNVTVYGIVDLALSHFNGVSGHGKGSWTGFEDGGSWNGLNGSRIGFKGTEDLGGGLSTFFDLQAGFAPDTGASTQQTPGTGTTLFGRHAYVGLGSKTLGSVILGRQDTLLFEALGGIDPFGLGSLGAAYGGRTGGGGPGFFYGGRVVNAVTYKTVNYSGFSAGAQYSFGEVADQFSLGSGYDVNVTYANGPLTVTADYTGGNSCNANAGALSGIGGAYGCVAPIVGKNKVTGWLVGGTYDLKAAKVHAAAGGSKSGDGNVTNDRTYLLGVTVPVGSASVYASWVNDKGRAAVQQDSKSDQYAIGAQYNLSKRTYAYTAVAYTRNKQNAGATPAGFAGLGGAVGGVGVNGMGYQVGLGHVF